METPWTGSWTGLTRTCSWLLPGKNKQLQNVGIRISIRGSRIFAVVGMGWLHATPHAGLCRKSIYLATKRRNTEMKKGCNYRFKTAKNRVFFT
jgi:hypothetical protein